VSSLARTIDAFSNEIDVAEIILIGNEGIYIAVFAWITIQIILLSFFIRDSNYDAGDLKLVLNG
jgi:hypothetical protein